MNQRQGRSGQQQGYGSYGREGDADHDHGKEEDEDDDDEEDNEGEDDNGDVSDNEKCETNDDKDGLFLAVSQDGRDARRPVG